MKKVFTKRKKWRRLSAAVVLLLAVWTQAKADVDFVPVDAGFDNGVFWVEVKNIGSDNYSTTDTKLGIYFKVCDLNTTNEKGNNTGTWNDQTTWTINAGETLRFIANGGKTNDAKPDFGELNDNTSYTLEVEINNQNSIAGDNINNNKGYFNFTLSNNKSTVTIDENSKTFYNPDASALNLNVPMSLEQGKKYTYMNAQFVRFWGDARDTNGAKVYTFGWFDEDGTFKGVSGNYLITAPNETGRPYGGCYLDVEPLANNSAEKLEDKYKHYEYDDNGNPTGKGAIYIGGSSNGFGIPAPNNTYGWDKGEGNGNNEIKGGSLPQIEEGKYQFELSIGTQVNSWGETGKPLLFKLYHYKVWQPYEQKNFEFKHESKTGSFYYNNKEYQQTTYYIDPSSPLSDVFEITNSSDPALGNGNVHGKVAGIDSDIPNFPNGYSFTFTLDATNNHVKVPLKVELTHRPDEYIGEEYIIQKKDGKENFDTYTEKTIDNVKVNLSAEYGGNKAKRISLRDALRFDWNILYDNTDPNKEEDCIAITNLEIKGQMDSNDLYYLGDLVKIGKITNIDLSDANIDENQIPADFSGNNDQLKTIILPNSPTSIGSRAFEGCKNLETVKFNSDEKVLVGIAAFKDCKKLSNETIQEIVNHTNAFIFEETFGGTNAKDITIPADINQIRSKAFANTPLERLTVPVEYKGENKTVESFQNYRWPGGTGEISVRGNTFEEECPAERTLSKDKTTITLQAEDFNTGNGYGYNNNGDQGTSGNDGSINAHDNTYRKDIDNNNGFAIITNDGNHKIGHMKTGYWFKYTFRVEEEGTYDINAFVSTGSDGNKTVGFSIDEGASFEKEIIKTDWNPWDHEVQIAKVELKPGIHYITYHAAVDCDLDKIMIWKDDNSSRTDIITPGYNFGDVYTEYRIKDGDANTPKQDVFKSEKNAFEGVNANHCEVVFKEDITDDMVGKYRNTDINPGIRYLLTKTLDDTQNYDVVHQKHADAVLNRSFNSTDGWFTIVLPFKATANILYNTKEKKGQFDRAAVFYDEKYGVSDAAPFRFMYIGEDYKLLKDAIDNNDADAFVEAGKPFIIHGTSTTETTTFEDVETEAGYNSEIHKATFNVETVNGASSTAGDKWEYHGNVNGNTTLGSVNNTIWFINSNNKLQEGYNITVKGYRGWFVFNNPSGARPTAFDFNGADNIITGISSTDVGIIETFNVYNLQGQIVKANTVDFRGLIKGIYIVNGKKVIVK